MKKKRKLWLTMGATLLSLWSFAQGNTSKLIPADCGINNVHFQQTLTAEQVQGATKYEFRLRNSDLSYSETLQKNTRHFQLSQFSVQPQDQEAYEVDVRVKQGNNFGTWGQVCQIQANDHPNTELIIPDCGRQNVKDSDKLNAKAVAGAIEYEFSVTSKATGQSFSLVEPDKDFSLDQLPIPLNAGTQLAIKVRTNKGSGFGDWGKECAIQILDLGTTKLIPAHCGKTQVEDNDLLYFANVPLANEYTIMGFVDSYVDYINITGNSFSIADFANLPYMDGKIYSFGIKAKRGSISGSHGDFCSIVSFQPPGQPLCGNLVTNNSFEIYSSLVNLDGQLDASAINWNRTSTNATPDYYHKSFTAPSQIYGDMRIPNNWMTGNSPLQPYLSDSAYAGAFMSAGATSESFYQQLVVPMIAGGTYYVSVEVAHAASPLTPPSQNGTIPQGDNFPSDNIHIFFDNNTPFVQPYGQTVTAKEQIDAPAVMTNNGWATIGGFVNPTANLNVIAIGPEGPCCGTSQNNRSIQPYYFFDHVQLYDLSIDNQLEYCGTLDLGDAFPCNLPSDWDVLFQWRDHNNNILYTGATPEFSIANPTASYYTLRIRINGTWQTLGNVTYQQLPTPNLTVSNNGSPNTCYGQTAQICASINGVNVSVDWTFPNGLTLSNFPCINTSLPGKYIATYTTPQGCMISASYTLAGCCGDDSKPAVILGETYTTTTYSPVGNPLPKIQKGAVVYLAGNVIIEGYGKNLPVLDQVEFIVRGSESNGIVDASYLTFSATDAEMYGCSFSSICREMWGGIVLENQSSLFMRGGTVQDAYEAVQYRDHEVQYTLEDVTFANNYRSVVTGLSDAASFSASVKRCTFTSSPSKMKNPFANQYANAHIAVLDYVSTSVRTAIEDNTFENCAYGVLIEDQFDPNLFFAGCTFENCFIGGIYNATPFISESGQPGAMRVKQCTFNVPTSMPQTGQFPAGGSPTGVYIGYKYQVDLVSNIFTSTGYEARGAVIQTPGVDITAIDNYFTGFDEALAVQPYAFDEVISVAGGNGLSRRTTVANITVEGNTFEENYINLRVISNGNLINGLSQVSNTGLCPTGCPASRPDLITFEMHCNEFIAIDQPLSAPNGAGTGLLVDANTEMNDIGDCNSNEPAGNGWPVDEIQSALTGFYPLSPVSSWSSPQDWLSINSLTNVTIWEYRPYENEFVGNTNGITSPVSLTQLPLTSPNSCATQDALSPTGGANCSLTSIDFPILRPNEGTNGIEGVFISGLGNAYPNPANSTFYIPYSIESPFQNARIEVLDLKGTKVYLTKSLADRHGEIVFSTEKLQQGIFLYRLIVDEVPIQNKSVVIIK